MSDVKHEHTVLDLMRQAMKCASSARLYQIAGELEKQSAWSEARSVSSMADAIAELEAEKRLREALR